MSWLDVYDDLTNLKRIMDEYNLILSGSTGEKYGSIGELISEKIETLIEDIEPYLRV